MKEHRERPTDMMDDDDVLTPDAGSQGGSIERITTAELMMR